MNSVSDFFKYSKEKAAIALKLKEPKVEAPKSWYDKMYLSYIETKKTTYEYLNSVNKSLKEKSCTMFSSLLTFDENKKYISYPWYKKLYCVIKDKILCIFGLLSNDTKETKHEVIENEDKNKIIEELKSFDGKSNEKNTIWNICSSIKSSEISFRKKLLKINKSSSLTSDEGTDQISLKNRTSDILYTKSISDNAINSSHFSKKSSSTDMVQDASSNDNSEINEDVTVDNSIQIEKNESTKTAATFTETFFKNTWATISKIVP